MLRIWFTAAAVALTASLPAMAETASTGQARKVGVTTCAPLVEGIGKHVSGQNEHYSVTTWNKNEPDGRLFNSQVITKYSDGHSVAAFSVVPAKKGTCDGSYTQVFYSEKSCSVMRETIYKDWDFSSEGAGLVILENDNKTVNAILMPAGPGCVAVRTEVLYDWEEG